MHFYFYVPQDPIPVFEALKLLKPKSLNPFLIMKGPPFEFEEWGAALHPPFGLLLAADPLFCVNGVLDLRVVG